MTILKNNKGHLLLYFLLVSAVVATAVAVRVSMLKPQIKVFDRSKIIEDVLWESFNNSLRAGAFVEKAKREKDKDMSCTLEVERGSLFKFMKEVKGKLSFSENNLIVLNEYIERLKYHGVLVHGADKITVFCNECDEVYKIYDEMQYFFSFAKINGYNFKIDWKYKNEIEEEE